jgi:alpha-ketoglutarate-dependent taurine dioxygenase
VDTQVLERLRRQGTVVVPGTVDDLLVSAKHRGWKAIHLRRGDPLVSDLRPVSASDARPNSLSSRTGTGPQPLHTDGAHLEAPPDVVAPASTAAHPVPTRIFRLEGDDAPWHDLWNGVFRISTGRRMFLCEAVVERTLRFDPFCMTPCDSRAIRVAEFFVSSLAASVAHEWNNPQPEVLLIDNRRVLHAREAVPTDAPPRRLQRVAFRVESAS